MAIFAVGFVLVFLLLPWLIAWFVWSMFGLRNPALRLVLFGVIAWGMWQHFQLPYEKTAKGQLEECQRKGYPTQLAGCDDLPPNPAFAGRAQ